MATSILIGPGRSDRHETMPGSYPLSERAGPTPATQSRHDRPSYSFSQPNGPLIAKLDRGTCYRDNIDCIRIAGERFDESMSIEFHRTLRVPDNDSVSNLPASFGTFPLYSIKQYESTLPAAMAEKGGLFFSMYQREAMWIRFYSPFPFMVKIYVGGINAVSGNSMDETEDALASRRKANGAKTSSQDYICLPDQLWLDGTASSGGQVRQFVAMPFDTGYSIETQLAGEDIRGGLQFEIIPNDRVTRLVQEFSRLKEADPAMCLYIKTLTGKTITVDAISSLATVMELKQRIQSQEGIPPDQQRIIWAGKQLRDDYPLQTYAIINKCKLHLVLRLRGGGTVSRAAQMGISAGGLIKQCIMQDFFPADSWEPERAISFNVQILNSEYFQALMSLDPPPTPISAGTYAACDVPFFDIYNEQSSVHGAFASVCSVKSLDAAHAKAGSAEPIHHETDHDLQTVVIPIRSKMPSRTFEIMQRQRTNCTYKQMHKE